MSRKKAIHSHYEPRISSGRQNFDVLDWRDAASQRARFQVLIDHVALDGKSLLDVGCGLGDLWAFLKAREIPVRYTGVDLIEKMVAAARQRRPGGRFLCRDVFAGAAAGMGPFDVVFSSGAFNLELGNNMEFLARAVPRLLDLAGQTLAFNLLHTRTRDKYDHCAYYDPDDVLAVLAPLPCEVRILDDYLPNDFTVLCRKSPAGDPGAPAASPGPPRG